MATLVLADDDDALRDVYGCALKAAGHVVHEARDGAEAIEVVRRVRPGILLLDLWMPRLTGFDVLDTLRHDPVGSFLKVMVVSNLADADSRLEAFEAGACEYLVKARPLSDMLALVSRMMEGAEVGIGPA